MKNALEKINNTLEEAENNKSENQLNKQFGRQSSRKHQIREPRRKKIKIRGYFKGLLRHQP